MAIDSCVKWGTLWQLDDSISLLYLLGYPNDSRVKLGHSKDCTRQWCGGCLPEALLMKFHEVG